MDVDIISLKKCLQDLEEVLQKLENKPITNNEEKDSRLQKILDELAGFIDSHKKYEPEMEFDYLIWQSLKELLKDKTYGLKAILLLWNWVGNNRKHYLLSTRFPWKEDYTDNVNSISDWLLKNCSTEMMFVFLNAANLDNTSKKKSKKKNINIIEAIDQLKNAQGETRIRRSSNEGEYYTIEDDTYIKFEYRFEYEPGKTRNKITENPSIAIEDIIATDWQILDVIPGLYLSREEEYLLGLRKTRN